MVALVQSPASRTTMLKVTAGIHNGVALALDDDSYRIGASADCDLVFNDAGVSPHHLTLKFQGRQAIIEANGGAVALENGLTIPPGHGCQIELPAALRLGDAAISLGGQAPARLTLRRQSNSRLLLIAGGAAVLTALAAVQVGANNYLNFASSGPVPQFAQAPIVAASPNAGAAVPDGQVRNILSAQLQDNGLDNLAISTDGARFTVTGELDASQKAHWDMVQSWFDRTYGNAYVLESRVMPRAVKASPNFRIQAVWFGDVPYAISANGTRLYRGAAIEDGWIIKDIQQGKLVAGRQGEEFVLTF